MTTNRATPEMKLIDSGWTPPTDALRTAIERREAFRSAIEGLKTRGDADARPINEAIAASDRDGIITAIVASALGEWLDRSCQRPETDLTAWSATIETALRDAIWSAAPAVLDSLPASPDAAYLLAEATTAATPVGNIFMANGQPARPVPSALSFNRVMVPR